MVIEATLEHRLILSRILYPSRGVMVHASANEAMSDLVNDSETQLPKDPKDPTRVVELIFLCRKCYAETRRSHPELWQYDSEGDTYWQSLYARFEMGREPSHYVHFSVGIRIMPSTKKKTQFFIDCFRISV